MCSHRGVEKGQNMEKQGMCAFWCTYLNIERLGIAVLA